MGRGLLRIRDYDTILVPPKGAVGRLLCQDIVQVCLSLAAVGALERVGHATSKRGTYHPFYYYLSSHSLLLQLGGRDSSLLL